MTTRRLRYWPDWCENIKQLGYAIHYVLEVPELLSDWDFDFLQTINSYRHPPSEKQFNILFDMIARRIDYAKEQAPKRPALRIVGGRDYETLATC
jgi:hypothetical protein